MAFAGQDEPTPPQGIHAVPDAVDESTELEAVLASLADNGAALALINQLSSDLARARKAAADLSIALESNREIGAATGILMAQRQVTQSEAFDLLRSVSQTRHIKIRELAREVVETGILHPAAGKGSPRGKSSQD